MVISIVKLTILDMVSVEWTGECCLTLARLELRQDDRIQNPKTSECN